MSYSDTMRAYIGWSLFMLASLISTYSVPFGTLDRLEEDEELPKAA